MRSLVDYLYDECPYNQFAEILSVEGVDMPGSMGGNCFTQVKWLIEKLEDQESIEETGYIRALMSNHVSFVYKVKGKTKEETSEIFFHDPYILQDHPVSITQLMEGGNIPDQMVPPNIEGLPSLIKFLKHDDRSFRVIIESYDPKTKKYINKGRYEYKLAYIRMCAAPVSKKEVIYQARRQFSMRVLLNNGYVGKITHATETHSEIPRGLHAHIIGERKIVDGKPGFYRVVDDVAFQIGTSRNQLLKTIRTAVEFYESNEGNYPID